MTVSCLWVAGSVEDARIQRDQLVQKLNEYIHRREQLERFCMGAAVPSSAHPDAEKHRLFNGSATSEPQSDETDEDWAESAEIRWYLGKGEVCVSGNECSWGYMNPFQRDKLIIWA